MLTDSAVQPVAALLFLLGGAVVYFAYEVLRLVQFRKRLAVLSHILDGIYALCAVLVFIGLTELFFGGRVKYYTLLCFLCGGVAVRLTLKPPIRKFLFFLKSRYILHKRKNTKDIIEEDTHNDG